MDTGDLEQGNAEVSEQKGVTTTGGGYQNMSVIAKAAGCCGCSDIH
jgi:hypothetical protein